MKILIADDDRVTRGLLKSRLSKWGHEVITCENGDEALEYLSREDPPKLAVLDWMMPGISGVDICRRVRSIHDHPYTYLILLTSKDETADIVEGLDSGADDYIVKPFNPNELKVRVRAGVRLARLQEQLRSALELSEYRASHDPLTGLLNRGAILNTLRKELERAKRDNSTVSVIIADIDHFKTINDRYGHPAGDAVLIETARRLDSAVRPYDSVGRYGGEEFLIVVPECTVVAAAQVAERIREAFSNEPIHTSENVVVVTLSSGVAEANPMGPKGQDEVIRFADAALYRAKEKRAKQS